MYYPLTLLTALVYFFYFAAVLSLWIPYRKPIWLGLFCLGFSLAILDGRVSGLAPFNILAYAVITYFFFNEKVKSKKLKELLGWGIALLSLALGTHLISGFNNFLLLTKFRISNDAAPIETYLNLDKSVIGIFLLGWSYKTIRTREEWKSLFLQTTPLLLGTVLVLIGLPWILGFIRLDLKWYPFSWIWLLSNLLFTSVTEEAFFRGLIQGKLIQDLVKNPFVSWGITSFLFGLLHIQGGLVYMGVTWIAGLFYGYAFLKTKRLEASILIHFTVNAIHFVMFTYPSLM